MEVSGRTEAETKIGAGENSAGSVLCQPCGSEGENIPADSYCITCSEFICSSCLRVHRKLSVTKNHVIKPKNEMQHGLVRKDPCTELCAIHETEIVKFYCEGHNEVGCGDCMVLEHKTCKVQLVPKVSSNYGNSEELNQIKVQIEDLTMEIDSWKQKIKSNIETASEINMKVVAEIKIFRKDVNSYLDNAEAEILIEVEQLKIKNESLQKKLQDECDSLGTDVEAIQHSLERHSDKVNQLFVTAKQAQKKLQMCQKSIERMENECRIYDYSFEPSNDLVILKKTLSIGSISVQDQLKKEALPGQHKTRMVDIRAEFVKKLNIKEGKDSKCRISGLALISDEEILLADFNNTSLKLLNVKDSKITSKYSSQPPTEPWDVTMIDADTAAATLPGAGKIVFLNIKPDGMTESHSLKVKKGCWGIDHRDGIIAVSFCNPPALQILNYTRRCSTWLS